MIMKFFLSYKIFFVFLQSQTERNGLSRKKHFMLLIPQM